VTVRVDLRPGDDLFPHGGEPVLVGGEPVDYLRAAAYGHAVAMTLGLAYLPVAHALPGAACEIQVLGEIRPGTVVETVLYDPDGSRMRA
jgi:dimethylglycine dehydrogenase